MNALSAQKAARLLAEADAVLSDLDGTLIDSHAAVARTWTAFAERHGLDPEAVIVAASGRPSAEMISLLAPDADQAAEAAWHEDTEVGDTAGVVALPGALDLLRSARTVAIVTSCSRRLARARLAAAGLPEPAVMVCSDDVAGGKPDPQPFQLGAQRIGVLPERCVVLEDAPAGIASGRAAGARVIAVRGTQPDPVLAEAGADQIVDSVGSVLGDGETA